MKIIPQYDILTSLKNLSSLIYNTNVECIDYDNKYIWHISNMFLFSFNKTEQICYVSKYLTKFNSIENITKIVNDHIVTEKKYTFYEITDEKLCSINYIICNKKYLDCDV